MNKSRFVFMAFFALASIMVYTSCTKEPLLFSLSDDITLGKKFRDSTIFANPQQYPILSETQYASSYAYLKGIRDKILNSGEVTHKDDFDWEVYIIKDDTTLNAFCVPGGYIFVYTGIIKYLNTEDEFAGVLAHEIAHADKRHSTRSMEQEYGISTLLSVVLGDAASSTLVQIGNGLLNLKFSRTHEKEADKYSVHYLSGTNYACNGAAGFFQQLEASSQGGHTPAFLSTHPSPDTRITDINAEATSVGCDQTEDNTVVNSWASFKASLPQ